MIHIDDVKKALDDANSFSYTPDSKVFPVYKEGDVIDEDRSVRWNREEIVRRNQARTEERKRLITLSNQKLGRAHQLAVDYIVQETGLNSNQAEILKNYVWDRYHAYANDYYNELDDVIDMFNRIVEARSENLLKTT